jgi:phosphoribosyl-AMP cyclohydrolase
LPDALLATIVAALRRFEPDASAVLVAGSYAKGTASETSDLDLVTITTDRIVTPYRMWFAHMSDRPPLHVSVAAKTSANWLAARDVPAKWALGFPAREDARYIWSTGGARRVLGDDPSIEHPAAPPELEDLADYVLKAKRCAANGDEIGLRWYARAAAILAPLLLIPLNEPHVVRDPREAVDAALSLRVAPFGFAEDLRVTMGLATAASEEVRQSVSRLGRGLLAFLRERAPETDPMPDLARYLIDGTLERYLDAIG